MGDFLVAEQISFHYPRGAQVLHDCSFRLQANDTVWLSGNNGSGKTTLGKLLIGLLSPQAGRVMLAGDPVDALSLDVVGAALGYLFQNPLKQLFCTSVWEEVAFGLRLRQLSKDEIEQRVETTLTAFDLWHRKEQFPHLLSRGEQQRLALAAIVALQPAFLIFDEPTTGLDDRRLDQLERELHQLRQRGIGYLIISHEDAFCRRNAERQLHLSDGRVIEHV